MAKSLASLENKGERCSFTEDRGSWEGCYKQEAHCSKLAVPGIVASHWLGCQCLSLARLLPGKEEAFLLLE